MTQSKVFRRAGAAALLVSCLAPVAATAAPYTVQPVKNAAGDVTACQAVNETAGLLLLAAGDQVVLFAQSAKYPFGEADKVGGTWSVDGGSPVAFTSDGGGARMVAIPVPNTAGAVSALTTGKTLTVTAKEIEASFDLAGTADAFSGLIQCMTAAGK